jgi:hypothetical protein
VHEESWPRRSCRVIDASGSSRGRYKITRVLRIISLPTTLICISAMLPARSLLSLLVVAVSLGSGVTAAPASDSKVTLAFARNVNITGSSTIAAADRARAKVLQTLGLAASSGGQTKRAASFAVTNAVVRLRIHLISCMLKMLIISIGHIHCQRRSRQSSYIL